METFQISENFPTPIVQDFKFFVKTLKQKKVPLTSHRGFLKRKELFALNSHLNFKRPDATDRMNQASYPVLHLFYYLARNSRLFLIDQSGPTNVFWQSNDKQILHFLNLTPTEQYFFMFKTLWMYSDWEEIQPELLVKITDPGAVDAFFEFINNNRVEAGVPVKIGGPRKEWSSVIYKLSGILFYLELFGFWKCHFNEVMPVGRQKYADVEMLTLTPFGKSMIERITTYGLPTTWNYFFELQSRSSFFPGHIDFEEMDMGAEALRDILDEMEVSDSPISKNLEEMLAGFLPDRPLGNAVSDNGDNGDATRPGTDLALEDLFRDLFPPGDLGSVDVQRAPDFQEGSFLFKVYLKHNPDIWRVVQLDATHTLFDLHKVIQEAFEFDDDHLFAFYLDDKLFSKIAFHDDRGGQPPFAGSYLIGHLGIPENAQFLYLFDFGDHWEFEVLLKKIDPNDDLEYPLILEEHGEAPPQYPNWEEDE